VDAKEDCEDNDATWGAYDPITEEECTAIPSLYPGGGWWFDGEVGGFQFEISGITITNASSPTGFISSTGVTTNPNNVGAALLIGFSLTAETISAGSDVLLTQITFTDFDGSGICFGEDTGSAGYNAISGLDEASAALYVAANWGDCYCPDSNPVDDCGVCGGNNESMDCAGECGGDAVIDECGECGGDGIADGACDCDYKRHFIPLCYIKSNGCNRVKGIWKIL